MSSQFLITLHGKVYSPDGAVEGIKVEDVPEFNRNIEEIYIESLKLHPASVFAYVKLPDDYQPVSRTRDYTFAVGQNRAKITSGAGTSIATDVYIGRVSRTGFGWDTYRRPVTCRIFGARYHGWYMESSGDYCRLKKSKIQD